MSQPRRFRRLSVAITAAAVTGAILLTGCSSSSHASAPSSNTTAASTAAASKGKLVVGLIGQFSGALGSAYAGIPGGLKAWADTVNSSGGLNGYQVDLKVEDIASGPAAAGLTAAQGLVSQQHAQVIIDFDSGDATWIPYTQTKGVPVIQGTDDGSSPLKYTNVFPSQPTQLAFTYGLVAVARQLGGKLGVGYCAESSGCATIPTVLGLMGLKPVVAASLSSSSPNYSAFCQTLKTSGVTSYSLFLPNATAAKVSDQCYQEGVKAPQLMIAGNVSPTVKSDPAYSGSRVIDPTAAPFWDTADPAIAKYRAALAKYTTGIIGTELDNPYPEQAWISGSLLAADVDSITGTVDASSIENAFYGLSGTTLGGLTAPLTYSRTPQGTPTYCSYEWSIQNGQYVVAPGGPTQLCAPPAVVNPIMAAAAKSA